MRDKCADPRQRYYLLIDDADLAITPGELCGKDRQVRLYGALNEFLHAHDIDVYLATNNSRLLSRDIFTEFRGRGDAVHVFPLTFAEYCEASGGDRLAALDTYSSHEGMPRLLHLETEEEKKDYLWSLLDGICSADIEGRYGIRLPEILRSLACRLCDSAGLPTSASRLAGAVRAATGRTAGSETVGDYLSCLEDAFLFSKARRCDVRRRRYFKYPSKFYCADIGLMSACPGFDKLDPERVMECLIFNELRARGFSVDAGAVSAFETGGEGRRSRKCHEIDFIASKGIRKYYIQSACAMDDEEERRAALRQLLLVDDLFRKVVVSRTYGKSWIDEKGILRLGLMDFLLDEDSLDR